MLNALAEDRGPDVFLIHNDWVGKYLPKISPMPATTKVAYQVVTGTVRKQQTWQLQTEPTMTTKAFKDRFADAVIYDAVRSVNVSTKQDQIILQDRIVGIPVSMDTLALYYNKDLLNAAGIATPPETWGQFQEQVQKLTKLDSQGNVVQSGAAIGTATNVERAQDILTAIMMQNGTQMAADDGSPTFHLVPAALSGSKDQPPAYEALTFYTDFASPVKAVYTWNGQQPNSLEAFIQGKAAFFFGYSYHLPQIRARAPKLNLGVTKLPQIENNPVKNVANYWLWAVSKKSPNQDISWNLLNFFIKPEENKKILDATKRPAALKALLKNQVDDEDVGVFASQVLTAQSWYRGSDPQTVEETFTSLVEDVVKGTTISDAMRFAAEKIAQTIQ